MAGFDTHIHSTASDGALSPGELVRRAKANGLLGMALTDHDTVDGLKEAADVGRELGFTVIPGIELSAEWRGREVHILGYWFDAEKLRESGRLEYMANERAERIRRICSRLELLGMPLDADRILAQAGGSPGRPHVANAMVEAGYAESVRDAFGKWLSQGRPGYVARAKLSPCAAVKLIRSAGGVAALAHPGCGVPDAMIPALVRVGIGGIEVYHSDHNRAMEKKYHCIARRYRLAELGGSDFHIPGVRELGSYVTTPTQLEKLAAIREQQLSRKKDCAAGAEDGR